MINTRKIVNLLFILYLLTYFLSKINPEFRIHYSFIVGFFLLITNIKSFNKKYKTIIFIIYFFSVFSFFNNLFRTNYDDLSYSILMLFFPGFVIAIDKGFINTKYILLMFYIYFFYILYNEFILNTDFNTLIPGGSRNFVGWLSLFLCITYYFICVSNQCKYSIVHSIVNLLISFIMQGRAGIIISFLLFIVVLYDHYLLKLSVKKLISFSFFIVVIIIIFSNSYYFFSEKLLYFDEMGLDLAGRDIIWQNYLDILKNDFSKIFTGVSRFEHIDFSLVNNNLHNSLISGHSNYGIFFILFILSVLYLIITKFRNSFLVSSMALLLLIRSTTDSLLFTNNLDFLFYAMIYYLLNNRSVHSQKPIYNT